MKRKDLFKNNKLLNNQIIELKKDIYKLIEEDYSIEKELIKLKYTQSKECEKLTWNHPLISSNGFFDLINKKE
jgi:hypothetical protein